MCTILFNRRNLKNAYIDEKKNCENKNTFALP